MSEPTATAKKNGETFGKPALTYIKEKNFERKLGRSLTNETNARATSWGKLVEKRAFDLLGTEYRLCSSETIEHPELSEIWAGSPDLIKYDEGRTVVDIKCPYTLKSFCELYEIESGEQLKDENTEYYWQLVSNAILTESKYAELIIYCPFKRELEDMRLLADEVGEDWCKWIFFSNDYDLPFLIEGKFYNNLKTLRFEVPQSDKDLLTAKIKEAGKLLIN